MMYSTYLYVGWYSRNYQTIGTGDIFQVYFDTDHDNTTAIDDNDYLLQIDYVNNTIYGVHNGAGSWQDGGTLPTGWAGANGITTGNITWETRFTLSSLNGSGLFDSTGDSIGFGARMGHTYNASDIYYLYFPNSCQHDYILSNYWSQPDTWGDMYYLSIPEFNSVILTLISIMSIGVIFINKGHKIKNNSEEEIE